MKLLGLLLISIMFVSCASPDRQVASQEEEKLHKTERVSDFEPGLRH